MGGISGLIGQLGESVRVTAQQMTLDKIAALKNHGKGLMMEGRTCNQYSQTTTGLVVGNREQNGTSSRHRKTRIINDVQVIKHRYFWETIRGAQRPMVTAPRFVCKRKESGDGTVFHTGEKMRKVDPWGILDGRRRICRIQLYKITAPHGLRRIDDGRTDQ